MLNFNRRPEESKDTGKTLRPAIYDPPGSSPHPAPGTAQRATAPGAQPATAPAAPPPAPATATSAPTPVLTELPGSKLSVGVNIKLKGVEISDCDIAVIEGHVEATVHSKAMQIARPGTLKGTALIDVAEIHGEFSGELTARTRLVVHSTGRVSGTIRYGKLIVEEGGELNGDVKRLDDASDAPTPAHLSPSDARFMLRPSRETN
jgi:cytoskeletal protein CcmA (bactofilin family)